MRPFVNLWLGTAGKCFSADAMSKRRTRSPSTAARAVDSDHEKEARLRKCQGFVLKPWSRRLRTE